MLIELSPPVRRGAERRDGRDAPGRRRLIRTATDHPASRGEWGRPPELAAPPTPPAATPLPGSFGTERLWVHANANVNVNGMLWGQSRISRSCRRAPVASSGSILIQTGFVTRTCEV